MGPDHEDDVPQRPWSLQHNPNTAAGELETVSAFASGLLRLTGWRRRTAQVLVVLIVFGPIIALVVSALVT